MLEVGEIRKTETHKQIYIACVDCGKLRWVWLKKGKPEHLRCDNCAKKLRRGSNASGWKGGRFNHNGYIYVWISPDDFFHPMANCQNRITEHRLVMAKHLGRCLHRWEIVHHKNHIRDDNRIGNLQLVSDIGHKQITLYETRLRILEEENEHLKVKVETLETRVLLLEAEQVISAKIKIS